LILYREIAKPFQGLIKLNNTIMDAISLFSKSELNYCPVVSNNAKKVEGVLVLEDMLAAIASSDIKFDSLILPFIHKDFTFVTGKSLVETGNEKRYIIIENDGYLSGINRNSIGLLGHVLTEQNIILDSIHNGIIAIDDEGYITIFNEASAKISGIKKSDAVGKLVYDIIPTSQLLVVSRTGESVTGEKQLINGNIIVTNRTSIVKDGKVMGAIGVFQNINDLERVSKKLDEEIALNQELEFIMDNSYDLITVIDQNGIALRASSSLEKMFGIKMEEFIGRNVKDLEKTSVLSKSVTNLVLQTKKRQTLIQDTKGGRRLFVTGVPIFDNDGNLYRIINFSHDITELSRLKLQLEETEELLKKYQKELGELRREKAEERIIARSSKMAKVVDLASRVAMVDTTVLITGESGSGKEVVARFIQDSSARKDNSFIKINCGAIPENLLESELFGYVRGAFTGASKEGKVGLVLQANKGTLFLDEIGDLPLALQVKVLQLIQEKKFYPVGGIKPIEVDIRIIAATHRNLIKMVNKGEFREDLYYRLNVIPIIVPPLRERKDEIPILVNYYLSKFGEKYLLRKHFSSEAIERLIQYSWPGNVRQLENMIERLVVTIEGETINLNQLPGELQEEVETARDILQINNILPLDLAVERLEKDLIMMAYQKYSNINKVAEVLGVHRTTILRKANKYFSTKPDVY